MGLHGLQSKNTRHGTTNRDVQALERRPEQQYPECDSLCRYCDDLPHRGTWLMDWQMNSINGDSDFTIVTRCSYG